MNFVIPCYLLRTVMALDSHLGGAAVPGLSSTAVPLREQFRCRRWWFFYHDIRAFTTSWLPLPIFTAYRIILALYVVVWLCLHIVARRDQFGPLWLIFITDLSYALLAITTSSLAVLSVVYTIVQYWSSATLLKYIPKRDFPLARVYRKQDNIPWYVKIIWVLYITACSCAFLVFMGYWVFVYTPCGAQDEMSIESSGDNNSTMGSGDEGSATNQTSCSFLDVHTIQVHGINVVIVFLDLVVSRIPYQFLHFVYASLFTFFYIIFSVIYWGAGGENHDGQPYIYSTLDYDGSAVSSGIFAVIIVLAPMVTFAILSLLSLLRDFVSKHVGCCFRDVKKLPYRDEGSTDNWDMNGTSEEDITTKV